MVWKQCSRGLTGTVTQNSGITSCGLAHCITMPALRCISNSWTYVFQGILFSQFYSGHFKFLGLDAHIFPPKLNILTIISLNRFFSLFSFLFSSWDTHMFAHLMVSHKTFLHYFPLFLISLLHSFISGIISLMWQN